MHGSGACRHEGDGSPHRHDKKGRRGTQGARIIRRYPHVRFRLAIAMRSSGPTWSKTRQHRPLMAWCQPICRHRPEAPDVSHIYWGIYQFQHVAEQFPQKGITQPRVVRNTPLSFDQAMLERDVKLVSGS